MPSKCYKVTTSLLCSAHVSGEYAIQYKLNEYVKPKVGSIVVFDTLYNANLWRQWTCIGKSIIFEAEAKYLHKPTFTEWSTCVLAFSPHIKYFWKYKKLPNYNSFYEPLPTGTLLASELKLIKEVE